MSEWRWVMCHYEGCSAETGIYIRILRHKQHGFTMLSSPCSTEHCTQPDGWEEYAGDVGTLTLKDITIGCCTSSRCLEMPVQFFTNVKNCTVLYEAKCSKCVTKDTMICKTPITLEELVKLLVTEKVMLWWPSKALSARCQYKASHVAKNAYKAVVH
jgi:hypothetical protein